MLKYTLFVSLIILFINSATCDDADEVKRFGLNRARQSYRFNHPPAAEDDDYEKIPVAVVYDKVIDRTHRRQKLIEQTAQSKNKVSTPENKETVTLPNDSKEVFEEKVTTETSIIDFNTSTEKTSIIKPEARELKLTFKIPVSVVYDDEPEVVKTNKIEPEISKRRKVGRRQRKPTTKSDEQTIVTIKPILKNYDDHSSNSKTTNNILEEASATLSPEENPKIDLNKAKTRGRNSRRRSQVRKSDSNIVKISMENIPKQINDRTTEINKPIVVSEYDNNETLLQIQRSESSPTNKSAVKSIQNIAKNDQTAKTSNSNATNANKPATKRDNGEREPVVPIVASENLVHGDTGDFIYSYEGGDGTRAFSKGKLKTSEFDEEAAGEAVEGGFSYKDKDGNDFSLSYTADENGYRPVGAHLPTPPPIPPAIARALAYLATKPTPEPVTEPIDEQEENTPAPKERS